ncbi:hypothetical protein Rsub_10698 [Raphidocelis subcapitata]|uniref:Uncharacterized protein n=1 Tax=Raphidocelis subcapitata TaxID=307507 RepID=A0A2V0PEB7_9CHLO|nr:hypothetical protein Rsub_10698 [Raphidocelis subcapitata]|eukprot:GBF98198.1 hypothetical protein Rsub_10698 [Raphidocelis subcapitata]
MEDPDEEWREYPVWLQAAVRDEAGDKTARVVDADNCGDTPQNGRVRVKAIELPDTLEQAVGCARQRYVVQENSVVLLTAGPSEQPYIGLVQKIWMEEGAESEEREGGRWYSPQSFFFEMYYFYRYREVVNSDGAGMAAHPLALQSGTSGGVLKVAKGRKGKHGRAPDAGSERQLMFSNHCTWEEEDEAARAICAESFLYAVQVHWLTERDALPLLYYEAADGSLHQRRAPGFVVRFFNYFDAPVWHKRPSRVYGLEQAWPHEATRALVKKLLREYREKDGERAAANQRLLGKHGAAGGAKPAAAAAGQQPGGPAPRLDCPSPRLGGLESPAGGGGDGEAGGSDGGFG